MPYPVHLSWGRPAAASAKATATAAAINSAPPKAKIDHHKNDVVM